MDVDSMSLDELKSLRKQVDKAISSYEGRKKKEALAELDKTARELGFSLAELTGTMVPRARAPNAPRYANPQDPSQTWTGRGRKPHWVQAALDAGKSLNDFSI